MGIYIKSWWAWIDRNTLDSFECECWNCIYFDRFGVEHIQKEIRKLELEIRNIIGNNNIITNIYKIQTYDSIMCEYFWVGFIDFILEGKNLLEHTNFIRVYYCLQ